VKNLLSTVTRPIGNLGYSAHIAGLTTTTSPVIQYAYTSLPNANEDINTVTHLTTAVLINYKHSTHLLE